MALLPIWEVDGTSEGSWHDPTFVGAVLANQPRFVLPDLRKFGWTLIAAGLPAIYFFHFILPFAPLAVGPLETWCWFNVSHRGWALGALLGLVATAFRNPGVAPRRSNLGLGCASGKMRIVWINGVRVKHRFCHTCGHYRPPRSKHCADCNRCVLRFDHHCTLIGNCVGLGNYRAFLFLLICTAVFFGKAAVLTIKMARNSVLLASTRYVFHAGWILFAAYASVVAAAVFVLILYHLFTMAQNLTTNEHVREYYSPGKNPFDVSCIENYWQFLCAPCGRRHHVSAVRCAEAGSISVPTPRSNEV